MACAEGLNEELAVECSKRQRFQGDSDHVLATLQGVEQHVGKMKAAVGE